MTQRARGQALDRFAALYGVERVRFETDPSLRARWYWAATWVIHGGKEPVPELVWYGRVWNWLTRSS